MEQELYIYAVHPKKIITDIEGVGAIRTAKSLYLSKEDVYKCLKKASVYRRFSFGKTERVTVSNVDRLHREKYMTEEEYAEFLKNQKSEGHATVSAPVVEPVKEEPVVEEKVEEVIEEPVINEEVAAVVEEPVEVTNDEVEIKQDEANSEEKEESQTSNEDIVVNSEENTDQTKEDNENESRRHQKNINQQYYSKKNKR